MTSKDVFSSSFSSVISASFLVVALLLQILAPQPCDALVCYQCGDDAFCNDPFNANDGRVPRCNDSYCLKIKSVNRTARMCIQSIGYLGCLTTTIESNYSVTACLCNTDRCNGSVGRKFLSLSILVLVGNVFSFHVYNYTLLAPFPVCVGDPGRPLFEAIGAVSCNDQLLQVQWHRSLLQRALSALRRQNQNLQGQSLCNHYNNSRSKVTDFKDEHFWSNLQAKRCITDHVCGNLLYSAAAKQWMSMEALLLLASAEQELSLKLGTLIYEVKIYAYILIKFDDRNFPAFLLVTTTLLNLINKPQPVQSTTCYNCFSINFGFCQDPFNVSHPRVRTCDGACCIKATGTSFGMAVVARYCLPMANFIGCRTSDVFGGPTTVCTCDTDLCNGSVGTMSASLLIEIIKAKMNSQKSILSTVSSIPSAKMVSIYLLAVFMLAFLAPTTESINCYQCGENDKHCVDPFDGKQSKVTNCTDGVCIKEFIMMLVSTF
ncbi:hypothetical protein HELRODRAFT_172525 [Helobdella robusta]|uniref:Protein quiver n=1 Tax=Helobdella robusta TaxID=6412 RepID=T1F5G6_HELRO|nr:hypothetical protein HELRODRAFT_172525 [Helobdella robusta]ESO04181.1 hypothetical protein HELRODRAFT_172525 [Helobdella robusta]